MESGRSRLLLLHIKSNTEKQTKLLDRLIELLQKREAISDEEAATIIGGISEKNLKTIILPDHWKTLEGLNPAIFTEFVKDNRVINAYKAAKVFQSPIVGLCPHSLDSSSPLS